MIDVLEDVARASDGIDEKEEVVINAVKDLTTRFRKEIDRINTEETSSPPLLYLLLEGRIFFEWPSMYFMYPFGEVEKPFGKRGFPGINMRADSYVSDFLYIFIHALKLFCEVLIFKRKAKFINLIKIMTFLFKVNIKNNFFYGVELIVERDKYFSNTIEIILL